jgi:hypothetical protein
LPEDGVDARLLYPRSATYRDRDPASLVL